ncbi:enoyl-CoA hydratase [Mycobacterium colombiense]|uniref:enoyl-CoA hydratase-related protein n=1 Tax=Mycobacterium colombiense TaxID=339268 RepID=UPI0007F04682|nr:enoyl-CoA hydratase-related protein [Mycobacterium colombiense]OBK63280.1 enoyl-CoA hydratase [Mycobacterium colombiense]
MHRPEKRNAVDKQMAFGISAALDRLEDDPDLWVGILTGTPDFFCAGTDPRDGVDARTERGGEYGIIRRRRQKPLISAVEGSALGGGMEIALACDLIVASTTALFALPETRLGIIPTSGALFRAIRALPLHIAKQLMIAGAALSAERAHALGLVNVVTEPGCAVEEALRLAADICASSPVAVQATLAAVTAQFELADEAGWQATAGALDILANSEDVHEGIAAFFERRPPNWRGR